MSRAFTKYRQGIADYAVGKPRPRTPPDDDAAWQDHHWRWIGWMIGRSNDIQKIIDELKAAGVHGTKEGDRAFSKRVARMDRALKFKVVQ